MKAEWNFHEFQCLKLGNCIRMALLCFPLLCFNQWLELIRQAFRNAIVLEGWSQSSCVLLPCYRKTDMEWGTKCVIVVQACFRVVRSSPNSNHCSKRLLIHTSRIDSGKIPLFPAFRRFAQLISCLKAMLMAFPALAKAASTRSRSWRLRWRTWITSRLWNFKINTFQSSRATK